MFHKTRRLAYASLIGILVLFFVFPLWAATFYVTPTPDDDCSDFACDLQSALNAASSNGEDDTLYLAAGTYDASTGPFVWNTSENFSLTLSAFETGTVIIDGGGVNQGMYIDTSNAASDTNAHITVRNIHFLNGSNPSGPGGGVSVMTRDANVTLEGCTISGSTATYGGGAYIQTSSGAILFRSNTLTGNSATVFGGGLCAFSESGQVTLLGSTFTGNGSEVYSGGAHVYAMSGNIIVVNNIFSANHCFDLGGAGANLGTGSGVVTVTNNTFTGNLSDDAGGGLGVSPNAPGAAVEIYNNIIWNNTAYHGGDIPIRDDIYICDSCSGESSGTPVRLFNNDFTEIFTTCGTDSNCTPNVTRSNNMIDADPHFMDTLNPDPKLWDLHIAPGSPCIDAGDNGAEALALSPTDLDGEDRVADGNYDGRMIVDIGADELIPRAIGAVTLFTPDGGEILPTGSLFSVKWFAPPDVVKFRLKYSTNNGASWVQMTDVPQGVYSYDWPVPKLTANKTKCRVKVIGYNDKGKKVGVDTSGASFAIEVVKLESPSEGGAPLKSDDPDVIHWQINGTKDSVASIQLSYTLDGGQSWKSIAKITELSPDLNSHEWTVPKVNKLKTNCKLKIVLKDKNGKSLGSDVSDTPFSISP